MHTPDFQLLLLPLLECLSDGEERSMPDIKPKLTEYVERSDKALMPFAMDQALMEGMWHAQKHLIRAGLVVNTRVDYFKVTSLGKMVLSKRLNSLDVDYLSRLPGYLA